ncbi:pentatricopeptide repeat-containing protein At2g34400-like [Henckelia pumila]|uniref:pentatricopeptide repeat-containing protein At2g34400-like n=1 Tax=Henckelia pumila TaxID=405737 RepID=UPI003C6E7E0C
MVYGYSKLYGVDKALNLFYLIPERDVVSWNTMISILSQHGIVNQTLNMFCEMFQDGFIPKSVTYASVISVCASIGDLSWGTHLHARIVRMTPYLDEYMGSALINLYAKCGLLGYAKQGFNTLKEKNQVAWASFIWGVSQFGSPMEAMEAFKRMREVPVPSDEYTLATVLGVCCRLEDKSMGELLQSTRILILDWSRFLCARGECCHHNV